MVWITILLFLGGLLAIPLGRLLWRRGRIWRLVAGTLTWLAALLLLAAAGYSYWYHHRSIPPTVQEDLFHGISYRREIRHNPRPMVIHVISIDLDAPGISFLVTPGEPTGGRELAAKTASQFLKKSGVQVAINGGGFRPWYAKGPLWYYPHVGDPVDSSGLTISRGDMYSAAEKGFPTVYISRDNRVSIGRNLPDAYNAVSGFRIVVEKGRVRSELYDRTIAKPEPRTAFALDSAGRKLLLIVVDGRQPNYSEGATLAELGEIICEHGGVRGINMDGGGSSTLVITGDAGRPVVLNSPIHGRVPPGRERPIATHLGVYARPKRLRESE